jgi:multisite-specific tRNA:(cytosine-C5)-methyltransferase
MDMPEPELRKGDQRKFNKPRSNQPFEEPFKYLSLDHEELRSIQDFYQISSRFPMNRFMVRNATGHPAKTMYYTSALARDILTENEGKGIKFVHCGVKMFVRQDVQKENVCKWRIQTEGLPIIEPWLGEDRVVRLWNRNTLRSLLVEMFPRVVEDGWRDLGEIGERVRDIVMGCCVLRIEPREGQDGFS